MELYKLQKRIVLSFDANKDENGDDDLTYVVDICKNADTSLLGFTLSSGGVRIINSNDYSNVAFINTEKNNMLCSHFVPFDASIIVICYQDGFIDVYDFRAQTKRLSFRIANVIFSASLLCGGKMIAAGDKENIYFYELETGKKIGFYRDVHSDVINRICPHPFFPTVFASGSEDGLICVFDIARGSQDDSFIAGMQTDNGVANLGWFGENNDLIWCCSMTRCVSVWNTIDGTRLTNIPDLYMMHLDSHELDYAVGCVFSKGSNMLFILCGSNDGKGYIISIDNPSVVVAEWIGHQSTIRCLCEVNDSYVTCGEDASICVWSKRQLEKGVALGADRKCEKERKGKDAYLLI